LPARPVEAVQHVAPERVAGGDVRVVEVVDGIVVHAEAIHHVARAGVPVGREGDDLVERERFEAEVERSLAPSVA
jgi:hypothetical protein